MTLLVRGFTAFRWLTPALAVLTLATLPARAQLARPRTAAPDAPKLLVLPFYRDNADSALSLLIADGARDRLRTHHSDKFNTIPRAILNENLVQSGFPPDVPLEAAVVRQLTRFLNVRYQIEASLIPRGSDSLFIVGRLVESQSNTPQSATAEVVVARGRAGSGSGADLVNRLVEGYRVFDEVAQCRAALDQQNYTRAIERAERAVRQFPASSAAYGCIASVLEAQNAPAEAVIDTLRRGLAADSLNTIIMRRLAAKFESRSDTTNLILMLRRVLAIDFRDNDLRINTARLLVQAGQTSQAIEVIREGLRQNPASIELLLVYGVAQGAAERWDSAAAALAQVAAIDSNRIDSLFVIRESNYYRQAADTANWISWLRVGAQRYPSQRGYVYTLGELQFARGDTAGAIASGQQYLRLVMQDNELRNTDSTTWRRQLNTGHLALARYLQAAGMVDSTLAHAEEVVGDSTLQRFTAPIFLQLGLQFYRDSNYVRAESLLQRAVDFGEGRALIPAHFFLGLAQVQIGVRLDAQAESERNCDLARRVGELWARAEQNIIAGAAQNRDAANQLLTSVIPTYKQRAEQLARNFCR